MNSESTNTKQTLIAKTLLWIAAVAALGAAVSAIPNVADASSATKVVEAWRMVGLATFASLFAVLAWRPSGNFSLWAITVFNKVALVMIAIVFMNQGGIKGVTDILVFDGGLVVLLVIAFALTHTRRPKVA
jgi:hypothetical protein